MYDNGTGQQVVRSSCMLAR